VSDSFETSVAAIREEFQAVVWGALRVAATGRGVTTPDLDRVMAAFDDAVEVLAIATLRLDAEMTTTSAAMARLLNKAA